MVKALLIRFTLASILAISTHFAFADNPVQLHLKVEKEIKVLDKNGKRSIQLVTPKRVVPGDILIYTTTYENSGEQKAEEVMIVNPIPKETTYIADSATGSNSTVMYSIDGGKQFDFANQLTVKKSDSSTRLASNKEYTHIRWTVDTINPSSKGTVQFRARLN